MKYLRLVWANLTRKKVRTTLTIGSFVVALFLYGLLVTIRGAFSGGAEAAAADRLNVINKTSLIMPLPISYRDLIAGIEGVRGVTFATWFGGVYQDERNFFPQFAVEPESWFDVHPDFVVREADRQAFLADRQAALVGRALGQVLVDDKNSLPGDAFKRGYFNYPTALLPFSKDYLQGAYLLTHFLMAEKGNSKLNTSEHKIVAYKIKSLMDVMKLNYSREDRNYQAFLNALEETQIIDRVVPDISTLRSLKPSRIQNQVVHLFVKRDIDLLDPDIKSNLLVTKLEEK